MRTRVLLASFAAAATMSAGVSACRGPDVAYDCDTQQMAYDAAAAELGQLSGYVPAEGPYAMAITFTEDGINDLLSSLLEAEIPFAGELETGTVVVSFTPEETPRIEIADDANCDNCVIYDTKFSVDVLSGGGPVASGLGGVRMQVPLELVKLTESTSALQANYEELELLDLDLRVFGFDSEEHTSLAGALRIILEEELRARFSATELFKLESWTFGEGEVELLARELASFPESGTISIGLGSNLELGEGEGFELDGAIGENGSFGLRIDNAVFSGMARRMLYEGRIPSIYNESGNPDPNGNYAVTMQGVEGKDDDQARLESTFRVWRLAFGYCGYAEVVMPLDFSIEMNPGSTPSAPPVNSLKVEPGTAQVVSGAGVGSVAARDDELVEQNQQLVDIFKQELGEVLGDTLDYSGLDLTGSNLYIVPQEVRVDSSAVWLDNQFIVLAEP